jgi:hypothetical protein
MHRSLSRVGLGGLVVLGAVSIAWSSLMACVSLSDTSPLPDGDASDLDGGFVPVSADAGTTSTSPADTTPEPSGRVRLANLIQGTSAVDLCSKSSASGSAWEGQKITVDSPAPKAEGLLYGEVSTHVFLPAVLRDPTGMTPETKYQFRVVPVGTPCDGSGSAPLVTTTAATLHAGGGLTVVAMGVANGAAASDADPRGVALEDVLAPPATSAQVRVFHGVPDLPPFDLVINGDRVLSGVKYGTGSGAPADAANGFASVAAGIPANAILTLSAGTTSRSFTVSERVRRGLAVSIFVSGSMSGGQPLTVNLCSDRRPESEATLADCTKLSPTK